MVKCENLLVKLSPLHQASAVIANLSRPGGLRRLLAALVCIDES